MDPLSAIVKLGGRLGNAITREQVIMEAQKHLDTGEYILKSGGGLAEQLIPGVGGGAKGGAYGDIVLENINTGKELIINTADTYANGSFTARELANGARIQQLRPDSQFMMIPKVTGGSAGVAAVLSSGSAAASDGSGGGSFLRKAGDFLLDLLVPGGVSGLGSDDMMPRTTPVTTPTFNGSSFSFGLGSNAGAAGGYLLYPNKPNNNSTQSAYRK